MFGVVHRALELAFVVHAALFLELLLFCRQHNATRVFPFRRALVACRRLFGKRRTLLLSSRVSPRGLRSALFFAVFSTSFIWFFGFGVFFLRLFGVRRSLVRRSYLRLFPRRLGLFDLLLLSSLLVVLSALSFFVLNFGFIEGDSVEIVDSRVMRSYSFSSDLSGLSRVWLGFLRMLLITFSLGFEVIADC